MKIVNKNLGGKPDERNQSFLCRYNESIRITVKNCTQNMCVQDKEQWLLLFPL